MPARTINAGHWTADFQLARAFWEAYQEGPTADVHVVCLGDPDEPLDGTALEIAAELARYHPNVYGTPARPVTRENLRHVAETHLDEWANGFLIAVAATWDAEAAAQVQVVAGEPLERGVQPPDWHRLRKPVDDGREEAPEEEAWILYPDVAVLPVVARPTPEGALAPVAEKLRRKCRDAVIDGILRFYFKMGYDHTRYTGRRGRGVLAPGAGRR